MFFFSSRIFITRVNKRINSFGVSFYNIRYTRSNFWAERKIGGKRRACAIPSFRLASCPTIRRSIRDTWTIERVLLNTVLQVVLEECCLSSRSSYLDSSSFIFIYEFSTVPGLFRRICFYKFFLYSFILSYNFSISFFPLVCIYVSTIFIFTFEFFNEFLKWLSRLVYRPMSAH